MNDIIRINVMVEGQAEETFVRSLLSPHLWTFNIFPTALAVQTGRKRGVTYRGGLSSYDKARRDITRWLLQDRAAYVTTMFDLYRLPTDFPGHDTTMMHRDPFSRVAELEQQLANDIRDARFIPYIQLHEFEGLLFSDIHAIDEVVRSVSRHSRLAELQRIRASFASPEEINDGEETAPSKRLNALYPRYDKVAFGLLIAERIGLQTIRRECPHFNDWITRLEALASA